MNLLSWLMPSKANRKRNEEDADQLQQEKIVLKQQLAQTSVTFERRWNRIQPIAEQALQSMREGHQG